MGFWTIIGLLFVAVIGVLGSGLLYVAITESRMWENLQEKRLTKKKAKFVLENKDKIRSDAFVAGYKHLAAWSGIELTKEVEEFDEDSYLSYEQNLHYYRFHGTHAPRFVKTRTVDNITIDRFNAPKAKDDDLRMVAEKGLDFDLSKALNSQHYLGGDEDAFREYYAGGAKFMADVADMDAVIAREKYEQLKRDRLIAARRQGLKEVGTRLSEDMKALTDARTQLFSTESVDSQWEAMKAEVERSCASDDPVVR